MKRRHRVKPDIIIDLTSLLDVIFIILLVVIGRQSMMTEKQEAELSENNSAVLEAQALVEEAKAKYELFMDQMMEANDMNEYVCVISVVSTYSEKDVTTRTIMVLKRGELTEDRIQLQGENVDKRLGEFKELLKKYIEENQDYPVVLSLNENNEKLLYRDENYIKTIFGELMDEYDNVYVKYKK